MLCVLSIVLASVLVVQRPSGAALQAPHLVIPASPVQPGGMTFDPITGDLFGTQPFSNSVFVIPKTSGTIFGQHVSANVEVTLDAATGLDQPADVVFDPQGNLYISNAGFSDSITVIGRSDTTVFGQSVSANVAVSLTAATNTITPVGMAFDSHGNLFVEGQNDDGWLSVIAAVDGTLFGQSVSANHTTRLTAMTGVNDTSTSVVIDTAGDVLVGLGDSVRILPASTGTRYGTALTANVATDVAGTTSTGTSPANDVIGMVLNAAGDLFYVNQSDATVGVVPGPDTNSIYGQSVSPNVATVLTTTTSGLGLPTGAAIDTDGNFFVADSAFKGNSPFLYVIAATSTTVFGQTFPANVMTGWTSSALLHFPGGVTSDSQGNVFVIDHALGEVIVYPSRTGSLFGQDVTAGVPVALNASASPQLNSGISIDAQGNLFLADDANDEVRVLPRASGTLFGQSVNANSLTVLSAATGLSSPTSLAFDPNGNLFIGNMSGDAQVTVLPAVSGTIYGQSVVANTSTALAAVSTIGRASAMAFDPQGNLVILDSDGPTNAWVLPATTGTFFGQAVTANTVTEFQILSNVDSATAVMFDAAGNLYYASISQNSNSSVGETISILSKNSGTFYGQGVTPNVPTVLVSGNSDIFTRSMTLDPQGNLFFTSISGLWELDGPSVAPAPAVTAATLAATGTPLFLGTGAGLLLLLLGVVVMTRSRRKVFSSRCHLDSELLHKINR